MVIAVLPLLFVVLGVLMYALSTNSKVQEIGRILFAAGAFALAFGYAARTFSIG